MTEQPPQQTPQQEYYRPIDTPMQTAMIRAEPSLPLGIIGGIFAALVGGIVWAIIVVKSGYEVGFVAWGIGILAGYAVILLARGGSVQLQVVAVLSAGLGILLGKYVSFVHELRAAFDEAFPGLEQPFGYFASESFRAFREGFRDIFSFYDLLWIGLAIVSAWQIARTTAQRQAIAESATSTTTPDQ